MKQVNLFGEEFEKKIESDYTQKIVTPTYEPKNEKPHELELVDKQKFQRLVSRIKAAPIEEEVKTFLILAASRHLVFNYQKIADYYAHSSKEVQELFEESALVIIDFNKAYECGYVKLSHDLANQYFEHYESEK